MAVPFCRQTNYSFMEVLGLGQGFGQNFRWGKSGQLKKHIQLWIRPGGDVHVGAGDDLAGQRGEGREESTKQVLQPGLGIPHVRGGDDEGSIFVQAAVEMPQQQQRAADVFQPFAAADQVVFAALGG